MKNFEIEVLNAGHSESVSLLSKQEMLNVYGGGVTCKKGFNLTDEGYLSCDCGFVLD